jgi:hypothetical protein
MHRWGQESLGGGYKRVEEIVVGCGVWLWAIVGVDRMEGGGEVLFV